ncbi:MAG: hypothetical protein AAF515_10985 [Pseudomonadota bacterium]
MGDVSATLDRATEDTDRATKKAGRDVNDAAIAIGHYMERQAQGYGEALSDAEKRVREGKFVDAIWHLGTDPIKNTEENAVKLAQESTLVNALAQVAATAGGGPQGAAAYAAWYTYRATGDVDLALRVGLTVGATTAAMGAVSDMPTNTTGELAKKAAVTGAIGGIGVAASGGDEEAIFEGFLRGGGMVLIRDGYKSYTGHDIDPRGAEGEAYCLTTNEECSPPPEAYVRDRNGDLVRDRNGHPKIDIRFVDNRRPTVGIKAPKDATGLAHELVQEGGFVMNTAAKVVPVVQAGAVFHDQWVIQWDMNLAMNLGTIAPAMVMTYYGTTGAVTDGMIKAALSGNSAALGIEAHNVDEPRGFLSTAFQCLNTSLTRTIQIDSLHNEDESVCRVVYLSEKGSSTPWYAEHNADYCLPKGLELVKKQIDWGWSCRRI